MPSMEEAITAFISTVEATGGVFLYPNGTYAPIADDDWIDLGDAYVLACKTLGRSPVVRESEGD